MKGKCNCGKPATVEYLIREKKSARTIKFCDDCKPKRDTDKMYKIS